MFDVVPDPTTDDQDGHTADQLDRETALTVQRILNHLAEEADNAAAMEAAQVPYWKACPDSVRGSRAAARALRAAAESLVGATPSYGA
jgi:hypothetical protein